MLIGGPSPLGCGPLDLGPLRRAHRVARQLVGQLARGGGGGGLERWERLIVAGCEGGSRWLRLLLPRS